MGPHTAQCRSVFGDFGGNTRSSASTVNTLEIEDKARQSGGVPYFKYLGPERVDVLERGEIRFTPANDFNDPFECLSDSRLIEHKGWQRQCEDHCVRAMLADPEVLRSYRHLDSAALEQEVRRIHQARYDQRLPELKKLARTQLAAARDPLRVLCLSIVPPDSPDAFLMWGHYTSSHRGFVIEFDDQHPWFLGHLPVLGEAHDAGPVEYQHRRPGWDIDDDGNASPRRSFVFSKSPHWSYEREYRLLRFAGTSGLESDNPLALVALPLDSIRSITLGVNCSKETEKRVVVACRHPALRTARLRHAEIHPDDYLLTVA